LAIEIPDDLRQEIRDLQSRLDKLKLIVKWEEPEKLHLTLNFLGRIEESLEPGIHRAVAEVCSHYSQFDLTPAFLETMYKKHEPSFIYLGISGELPTLLGLQKSLREELLCLKVPLPEKFFAHITIGRVKKADPETTKSILNQVRDFEFSPLLDFTATAVSLFESLISDKGSHYRLIRRFMLK
jgi:2'-5' RNA ligase